MPKSNPDYWLPKLKGNQRRDRETTSALNDAGWMVLRFWEHERPADVADAIEQVVRPKDER